jgi:hypothetical protein
VSVSSRGVSGNNQSYNSGISADGRYAVFSSLATNLVSNDHNPAADVYVHQLAGSGAADYTIKPLRLAFGDQPLSTSATRTFTLHNTSGAGLPITQIEIRGTDQADFTFSSACGNSVAAGASCTIKVTFSPTSLGAKTATLRVVAGSNSIRTRQLTGTGV